MAGAPKMSLSDFEILQTVGTGSFGRVRIARNKTSGDYVALKILKKSEILRLKQVDHIISENNILGMVNHPFLVNLLGLSQDDRYLYFVLEYIAGGELFTYLRGIGRLEPQHARLYAA
jgi:protein kinase A